MQKRPQPARFLPPLAACKLALGLAAFALTWGEYSGSTPSFPYTLYGILATVFAATGIPLLLGGREDRRAVALGAFFLVTATSWSNGPLNRFVELHPGAWVFALATALQVNAFMPFFLWTFVRDFPVPPTSISGRYRIQLAIRFSGVVGIVLFTLNLLRFVASRVSGGEAWASLLAGAAPQRSASLFYYAVLVLTIAGLLALLWRSRAAQRRGKQQIQPRLFLRNLFLAFGPVVVDLLLQIFVPPYNRFMEARPRLRGGLTVALTLPLLSLPFFVPYAVLVHRVMQMKMVARQALRYTLARWSALVLVTIPLASLLVYLYLHQGSTLQQIFSGPRFLLLLAAAVVGVAALSYRRMLLEAVDRRFFREQYDARHILTLLAERIRSIRDSSTLADLVSREIDLALHLEKAALLVHDPRAGSLSDRRSRGRKLDMSSPLALTLSNDSDPLTIDLENPQSPLLRLPEKERQWLAESGFRLLVPILSRDGSLLGVIGLGPKRSGLPFLREDRQLLHAIASNAAWVLELEQQAALTDSSGTGQGGGEVTDFDEVTPPARLLPAAEYAKECGKCGALHPSFTVLCGTCSRRLDPSQVPYILPGKFRFEKRIGSGGMGVVYAGSDLSLGRRVAIKTLRRMSPEDAMRLRREARTAAAVNHPYLAAVYEFETWKKMPMLVMELLEAGTLASRIPEKLAPRETVELGMRMADALAHLHSADILHRDIKPSNIGYTRDRIPKLMDFGIAGVIFELRQEEEDIASLEGGEGDTDIAMIPDVAVWETGSGSDIRHRFAGTLSYLSPEAVRGRPADASFDLWSLSVVLYECLLGRKVFTGTARQVVERIRAGRIPDFSQVCPEHGEPLAALFRDLLHPSLSRRPATARELGERLEEVRREIS